MQTHARELLSAGLPQESLQIVAVELCSAENQRSVHLVFLDGANTVLALQYLHSFRQRFCETEVRPLVRSNSSSRNDALLPDSTNRRNCCSVSRYLSHAHHQSRYGFSDCAKTCLSADPPSPQRDARFRAPRPHLSSPPKLGNASDVPATRGKDVKFPISLIESMMYGDHTAIFLTSNACNVAEHTIICNLLPSDVIFGICLCRRSMSSVYPCFSNPSASSSTKNLKEYRYARKSDFVSLHSWTISYLQCVNNR